MLDEFYATQLRELHELFAKRTNQGQAAVDLAGITRAATYGMVDTVLVDIDDATRGWVDDDGALSFAPDDDPAAPRVVDEIVRPVWAAGGRVMAVRRADVPHDGPAAAILRYSRPDQRRTSMSVTSMTRPGLVVRLDDIEELFTAPAFDPFSAHGRSTSGIEEIVADLRTRRLRGVKQAPVTLVLPRRYLTDDLPARVRAALDRYAEATIERARANKKIILHEGASKLRSELLIAPIVALTVALLLAVTPGLPGPLVQFLTPIVTIAIWVAIWNPVDSLLFDRWAENRTIDVHRRLQDIDVAVVAAEDRPDS